MVVAIGDQPAEAVGSGDATKHKELPVLVVRDVLVEDKLLLRHPLKWIIGIRIEVEVSVIIRNGQVPPVVEDNLVTIGLVNVIQQVPPEHTRDEVEDGMQSL